MPHGGRRDGAGRKPIGATARSNRIEAKASDEELAELSAAAEDAPLGRWLIESGLMRARSAPSGS